ncbi:hypothetical protein DIPPA_30138 [Diplonema papillatum]|nr:hypothetical protein DIPPA_30138 [Diplonema papillatum]
MRRHAVCLGFDRGWQLKQCGQVRWCSDDGGGKKIPEWKRQLDAQEGPTTVAEVGTAAGKDSLENRKFVNEAADQAHTELNRRMADLRRRLLADETRNKVRHSYSEEDLDPPEGSPADHVLVKDHAAFVTHMVPVDAIRSLVPARFTLNTIIHDMEECALITVRHERASLHPFRSAFGNQGEVDIVSYYTYTLDRSTGERVTHVFSHYVTQNKFTNWLRQWWSLPVHPFQCTSSVAYDEARKKFAEYSILGLGGSRAKAGALRLDIEDTGIDATSVQSFAGFSDAESALVFLTNNYVNCYQQLDYVVGRNDVWHLPLPKAGTVTVGKLKKSDGNTYAGITVPTGTEGQRHGVGAAPSLSTPTAFQPQLAPPAGVTPWLQFWDLMRINDRKLHSVLLFKGRAETVSYMPFHIYDEQVTNPTRPSKFRAFKRVLASRLFPRPVKDQKLSEADYEKLWKDGKYT